MGKHEPHCPLSQDLRPSFPCLCRSVAVRYLGLAFFSSFPFLMTGPRTYGDYASIFVDLFFSKSQQECSMYCLGHIARAIVYSRCRHDPSGALCRI